MTRADGIRTLTPPAYAQQCRDAERIEHIATEIADVADWAVTECGRLEHGDEAAAAQVRSVVGAAERLTALARSLRDAREVRA